MSEGANIEAEIAELEAAITEKRGELEKLKGIESVGKEVVSEVVAETFGAAKSTSTPVASDTDDDSTSYLDNLEPEQVEQVNALVDMVNNKGLRTAIAEAKKSEAFILDAFHDALVDKLHNELKERGII